jgi:hypothetical protein
LQIQDQDQEIDMIRPTQLLLTCLAGVVMVSTTLHAADVSQAEYDNIVRQLQADAELWIKGEDVSRQSDARLKGIIYTKQTVPMLAAALKMPRKDPVNLYVANKLIAPLLRAKEQVVADALPAVKDIYTQAGDYNDPPVYSQPELDALTQTPAQSTSAATTQGTAGDLPLTTRQKQKLAKDRPIVYHDQQLYELQKAYAHMLILANTRDGDQEVITLLKQMNEKGLETFFDINDYLAAQSGYMNQERGKLFYETMVEMLNSLRLVKKQYAMLSQLQLSATACSSIPKNMEYPGIRLGKTVNLLASAAKSPAQKVPTSQEVDAGKMNHAPSAAPDTFRRPGRPE